MHSDKMLRVILSCTTSNDICIYEKDRCSWLTTWCIKSIVDNVSSVVHFLHSIACDRSCLPIKFTLVVLLFCRKGGVPSNLHFWSLRLRTVPQVICWNCVSFHSLSIPCYVIIFSPPNKPNFWRSWSVLLAAMINLNNSSIISCKIVPVVLRMDP